jgi:ankyrin repeat protein
MEPPLFIAHGVQSSVTKQLIEARCNIDICAWIGQTSLHIAATAGHASVTEQLIEARCDVDLQDNVGLTRKCSCLRREAAH